MPVERLPIVVAGGLIGDPSLEIGMGGVWVIVLMILAVIPVVLLMRVAVRGLPPVVDMDVAGSLPAAHPPKGPSFGSGSKNDEPGFPPCRKEICQTILTWPNAGGNYFGIIDSEVFRLYLSDVKYGGKMHLFAISIYAQDQATLEDFAPTAEGVIDSVRAPISSA